MANDARMFWLHALTPLHVGIGRGVGYIDLPIMREKVTGWPVVPGSSVKGVLADKYDAEGARNRRGTPDENRNDREVLTAFGQAGDEHANSGSLAFTDARIVCLPVRSFFGTFAWVASPMVLQRLGRDIAMAGMKSPDTNLNLEVGECLTLSHSSLKNSENKVFLEDLELGTENAEGSIAAWADYLATRLFEEASWQESFRNRFTVVSDTVYNFLCQTGTEVNARVRIEDEKKTVVDGALWYEEALPAETVLCGLVWCDRIWGTNGNNPTPVNLLDTYCETTGLQIGGKATVGHGQVRCIFKSA